MEFLIAEYERANIDDGKKVVNVEYLKTLTPVLKTGTAKRDYNKTIRLLTRRSAEEIGLIRNRRPDAKFV